MSGKRDRTSYELGKQGARKLVRPEEVAKAPHVLGVWMDIWQKMAPTPEQPDLSATVLKTVRENADLLPKVCLGALFGFFTDESAHEQIINAYNAIADVSRDEAAARVAEFVDTTFDLLPEPRKDLALKLANALVEKLGDARRPVFGALFRQLPPGRAGIFTDDSIETRILDVLSSLVRRFGLGDGVTVATSLYACLRLLRDAHDAGLAPSSPLRGRLNRFISALWSQARNGCLLLGRDLARVTSDVSQLPEAAAVWSELAAGLSRSLINTWPSPDALAYRLQPAVHRHVGLIVSKLAPERAAPSYDRILGVMLPPMGTERAAAECGFADIARHVLHNLHPSSEALDKAAPARARLLVWSWDQLTRLDMKVAFLRALFWDWFQYTAQSAPAGAAPGDANCMWTLSGPVDYLSYAVRSGKRTTAVTAVEFLFSTLANAGASQQRVATALDGVIALLARRGRKGDTVQMLTLSGLSPKTTGVIQQLLPGASALARGASSTSASVSLAAGAGAGRRPPSTGPASDADTDGGTGTNGAAAGSSSGGEVVGGSAGGVQPVHRSGVLDVLRDRDSMLLEPVTPQVMEDTGAVAAGLQAGESGDWGVAAVLSALDRLAAHAPLRAMRAAVVAGARLGAALDRGSAEAATAASAWLENAPQALFVVAAAGRMVLVGGLGHRVAEDAKCSVGALAWSLAMSSPVGGAWLALQAGSAAAAGGWRHTTHSARAYAASVSLRAADWHIACAWASRRAIRPWSEVGDASPSDGGGGEDDRGEEGEDPVACAHPLTEAQPVSAATAQAGPRVSEAVRCALVIAHDYRNFARAAALRGEGANEATAHFWLALGAILSHAESHAVVEALRGDTEALRVAARELRSKPTEEGLSELVPATADASSLRETTNLLKALRTAGAAASEAPPAKRARQSE